MTILAQANERSWPVQDNAFAFSVDAAATRLQLTLEHPDWPEGECIRLKITWPTGDTGEFSSSGGLVTDKVGIPTGGTETLTWTCNKPADVTAGTVHVQTVQALRSAVLVEAF